ncbi:MAG: hypothetical protein BAA01_13510 [Bacillus thermozeamaize]|uniref:Enoyl-CoA hydratase n=1 Tax=Bacillus thermozeamaize TaxID=230954 RepID=A0A1Y3PE30_9BACI|nr:MAG: hypothetical protein BAA01_13510 [Bacillus thermozeamaize]
MGTEVLIATVKDGIGTVQLNRSDVLNALNLEVGNRLLDVLEEWKKDERIRVVVVKGHPHFFSAGADLKFIKKIQKDPEKFPLEMVRFLECLRPSVEALATFPRPTIAVVEGIAFGGGCELALACDLRIATPQAKFALPEVKIGLLPAAGGTQRLPRLIGAARAKELLFTGKTVTASEAEKLGLVNRVVPAEALEESLASLIGELTSVSPYAQQLIKRCVDVGLNTSLAEGLAFEFQAAATLGYSEDAMEGVSSFIEKRPARFTGR